MRDSWRDTHYKGVGEKKEGRQNLYSAESWSLYNFWLTLYVIGKASHEWESLVGKPMSLQALHNHYKLQNFF